MTTPNLSERDNKTAIEYDGNTSEICQGCLVNLDHDGTTITARVIECTDGEPWTAEVTDSTVNDLQVGATIEFEDRHVFRCAA